jgi:hypothetical protein
VSMSPAMRLEFEALIVGLAEAYGADKQDLKIAMRLVPKARRGPKVKNDEVPLGEMLREISETGRKEHAVALETARKAGGVYEKATKQRLYRKVRRELLKVKQRRVPTWLSRRYPSSTDAAAPKHFTRAPWVLDVAGEWRDRQIQQKIRIGPRAKR